MWEIRSISLKLLNSHGSQIYEDSIKRLTFQNVRLYSLSQSVADHFTAQFGKLQRVTVLNRCFLRHFETDIKFLSIHCVLCRVAKRSSSQSCTHRVCCYTTYSCWGPPQRHPRTFPRRAGHTSYEHSI